MFKKIYLFIIIIAIALVAIAFLFLQTGKPYDFNFVKGASEKAGLENVDKITTPQETTIIFGGDVMLSRVVGQKMVKYNDFTWPFKEVAKILSSADYTVLNLESPFSFSKSYLVQTGSFSFNADPKTIEGMELAGVDLVSLANNHFGNQGKKGMTDTFKILNDGGIDYTGAGNNFSEAHSYKKQNIGAIDFCFLGYAYPEDLYIAGSSLPGMANMDIDAMKNDIANAKKDCDQLIVLMHAGIEYVNKPNWQQKDFAHAAIDSGADLVIGHHPHWVQVTENYQGKPIIYSLGNLVFDQMWSKETAQGALAKAFFKDGKLDKIEIIPIEIKDYGQATLATGNVYEDILKRMELESNIISFSGR